ncbi:hypothetical protein D3C87_1391300 [compost metagenome]
MDVQGFGHLQLPHKPGYARKIRIGYPCTVIALGMGGIITEYGHRFVFIPETDEGYHRVDQTLGLGPDGRIFGGRSAAGLNQAVCANDAAVGRYLVYPCRAKTQMGNGLRQFQ